MVPFTWGQGRWCFPGSSMWFYWRVLAFLLRDHANILLTKQCTWEGRALSCFMAWLTLCDSLWQVAVALPYSRMSVLVLVCRKMCFWYHTVLYQNTVWFCSGKEGSWSCNISYLKVGCSYCNLSCWLLGPSFSSRKVKQQLLASVWVEYLLWSPSHLHVVLGVLGPFSRRGAGVTLR